MPSNKAKALKWKIDLTNRVASTGDFWVALDNNRLGKGVTLTTYNPRDRNPIKNKMLLDEALQEIEKAKRI